MPTVDSGMTCRVMVWLNCQANITLAWAYPLLLWHCAKIPPSQFGQVNYLVKIKSPTLQSPSNLSISNGSMVYGEDAIELSSASQGSGLQPPAYGRDFIDVGKAHWELSLQGGFARPTLTELCCQANTTLNYCTLHYSTTEDCTARHTTPLLSLLVPFL